MSQDQGNDLITPDPDTNNGPSESSKTAPLQDHIDSIFREFRKNVLINDDALAEMEATQQIIDIIHHRERIALEAASKEGRCGCHVCDYIGDRLDELNKEEHE